MPGFGAAGERVGDGFILNLVIKNIGTTAARNVAVKFDPPLASSLDQDGAANRVSEWRALTSGIPTLAPGQSMSTMIDSLITRYSGPDLTYTYVYNLDFNVFFGSYWMGRKSFDDLVKAVDEIRKKIESWTIDGGVKT
jgi:hypothetical protein